MVTNSPSQKTCLFAMWSCRSLPSRSGVSFSTFESELAHVTYFLANGISANMRQEAAWKKVCALGLTSLAAFETLWPPPWEKYWASLNDRHVAQLPLVPRLIACTTSTTIHVSEAILDQPPTSLPAYSRFPEKIQQKSSKSAQTRRTAQLMHRFMS